MKHKRRRAGQSPPLLDSVADIVADAIDRQMGTLNGKPRWNRKKPRVEGNDVHVKLGFQPEQYRTQAFQLSEYRLSELTPTITVSYRPDSVPSWVVYASNEGFGRITDKVEVSAPASQTFIDEHSSEFFQRIKNDGLHKVMSDLEVWITDLQHEVLDNIDRDAINVGDDTITYRHRLPGLDPDEMHPRLLQKLRESSRDRSRCASCGRIIQSDSEDLYKVTVIHHNYEGGPPRAQIGLTAPPTDKEIVFEGTARSLTDAVGKRAVTKHWGDWSQGGFGGGRDYFRSTTKDDPSFSGGAYYELRIERTDGRNVTKDEIRDLRDKLS